MNTGCKITLTSHQWSVGTGMLETVKLDGVGSRLWLLFWEVHLLVLITFIRNSQLKN